MAKNGLGWKCAVTLAALSFAGVTVSDDAQACGNGVERRVLQYSRDLVAAESNVEADKAALAARLVARHYPRIRTRRVGGSPAGDKALRLMARAVVRSGGALPRVPAFAGETPGQRAANLDWAVRVQQTFVARNRKDAAARTALGEALAALPKHRRKALERLESLEKNDLMASAFGYAALARLRREVPKDRPAWLRHALRALDDAPAQLAEGRCRKMAKQPTICGPLPEENS
jgi:hypothetical protein